jgi:hypothetical protein
LPEAVKTTNVTAAERMVKRLSTLERHGVIIYKVTNTFGIRSGLMLFLEEGHHSKGMDMVGYSRDGKQVIFL